MAWAAALSEAQAKNGTPYLLARHKEECKIISQFSPELIATKDVAILDENGIVPKGDLLAISEVAPTREEGIG